MSTNQAAIIAAAISEIEQPTWAETEQFLEVHQVDYENGEPRIAGVTFSEEDDWARVYFHVEGDQFYFAVNVDAAPDFSICGVGTAAMHRLSFHASSDSLSLPQLCSLTVLQPTETSELLNAEGDTVSCWDVALKNEPSGFSDKLDKFLSYLEQDAPGISTLAEKANGTLWVTSVIHRTYNIIDFALTKKQVQRVAGLNLTVVLDIYQHGNEYKKE